MVSIGHYDLEYQIGSGASGTVWKARAQGPVSHTVAVKRLRAGVDQAELGRIHREASILTSLDHPHVIRVLEVLQDSDGIALAMQFAPGGSLHDLLTKRGRLSPGEVAAVAARLADALASAHRRGVLHGDVKPANVLFTSDGEPLLSDFGVARTLGRFTSDQITGTPEYVAPELIDGAQPHPTADIYSLGVVCYEALSGHPPFDGPSELAVVRAADLGHFQSLATLPEIPPPLGMVVEQAMARDPARRFGSADQMAAALRAALPSDQVTLPSAAAGGPPDPNVPPPLPDRNGARAAGDGGSAGTRTFGPRPPKRADLGPARRHIPKVMVLGLVTAGLLFMIRGPLRPDEPACRETAPPKAEDEIQVVRGDPDGEGCDVFGTYGLREVPNVGPAMALTISLEGDERIIMIGAEGDQLLLGDWNCDDIDTPALYRPPTGEVIYYDTWPTESSKEYKPAEREQAQPNAKASIQPGNDETCDRIAVTS